MNRTSLLRRSHEPSGTTIRCPYCLWLLVGLALVTVLPGMINQATPFGPIWLLLLVLPFGSAVLRRLIRA